MSSSKRELKVVQHCSHIHPLTMLAVDDFICDGCNTHGSGQTYCCVNCDYHLHAYCAMCPPTILSFMHPQHELRLVIKGPERICDICDEIAEGLYYHCEACDFDAHPLCTSLPQHVNHTPHPAHPLELSHSGANRNCSVCRSAIRSWRYKCGPCGLDVHMECVNSSGIEGHTNQGQGQVPRPRGTKRRRAFRVLKFIAVEVIRNIITS